MDYPDLTPRQLNLLRYIHAKLGNRMKRMIFEAWETGIYDSRLVSTAADEQALQELRNTFGPSWLSGVKLSQLTADHAETFKPEPR